MDLMILLIALGLAMDSFSVSIANGLSSKIFDFQKALTMALFFGFFQAVMPLIGWITGLTIAEVISGFDHWVAFGLLCVVGLRMIYEAIHQDSASLITSFNVRVILILAVATSIDALAVGLSLSLLQVELWIPSIVIGVVTFFLSFLGVFLGGKFGEILKNKVEVLGGIILIIIGLRILLEHSGLI